MSIGVPPVLRGRILRSGRFGPPRCGLRFFRDRIIPEAMRAFASHHLRGGSPMRGILLWLLGIPIPIIILLYLFNVV
jgi:hypothetical protein